MKRLLFLLLAVCSLPAMAQQDSVYQVKLDLRQVNDDRLKVEMFVPVVNQDSIEFHIPKIVPGTYSISDFGRFMNDFQAFDANGDSLRIKAVDTNRVRIYDAQKLEKLSYLIDDTFDSELENPIFEPAGTNIEKGKNFVLNTFGFVGYLEGMDQLPFELHISRADDFYGATALPFVKTEENTDVFRTENYFNLADGPLMYSEPDTTTLEVGGAEVLVAVYSPNKVLTSQFVMDNVKDVLLAQKEYLGGELPVDRYAFLIYLGPQSGGVSGGWGALEHSYSSVYYLPEAQPEFLVQAIRDVAAHEFFHIVTPLNIHSEEIQYFDFINPEMSKHLWLYEGVTEYAAGHVQVKYDLIEKQAYLDMITEKMQQAEKFNDTLPFTVMSENCLKEYEDQYLNVYQKGALIGMSLDLKLLDLSDGEYNLQSLMRDLAKTYGKNDPFKDDELFVKIEELTYPEIRTFFEKHVAGSEPLPYKDLLALAGIEYHEQKVEKTASLGNIGLGYNPETQRIFITSVSDGNEFADDMKYKLGDELVSINGKELEPTTFVETVKDFQENTEAGERVKIKVYRKNRRGKLKKKTLRGRAIVVETEQNHVLIKKEDISDREQMIREAWLGK
jgi:predicted metalloprotease with PDZ domain